MKVISILTGLTGGFFIELILMRLTEKLVGRLLRSGGMKSSFLMFITARNIITLLVLIFAAMHSIVIMLSMGVGSILSVYIYIMKNVHIEKGYRITGE